MEETTPLRILHVVSIMNRAGLETMLINYYRHIDRSKIQFDFLVHREEQGDYEDEVRQLGGRIYHAPAIEPQKLFLYNKEVKSFFEEYKTTYRIVHCHLDALSTFPLRSAYLAGIPVRIAHSHTNNFPRDIKRLFRCLSKKMIPKYATDYMGCSQSANCFMFGSKSNEALVLPNAIDAQAFTFNQEKRNKMREKLHLKDKFVVGHVGRFDTAKNQAFVVEIFAHIHALCQEAVLLMIGSGETEPAIKTKVRQMGLEEYVYFMGSRGDIAALLQGMDVFLFPSRFEGLGIALLEAQAAGLHCLTSAKVVPQEVKVSELLEYVDLEKSAQVWADRVLQYRKYDRQRMTTQITKSGYDIVEQAQRLQRYYINCINKLQ